ncbi:MAG: hypothetical protein M5U26_20875 [Planctomycetota bacterium]|nr:hypothetical protein [Planctomycetota bacterium]
MSQPVLSLLVGARLRCVGNRVRRLKHESLFKVFVVAGLGAVFWAGMFYIFNLFFDFLNNQVYPIGQLLIPRILSIFFLFLLVMLAFSNALIGFSNMFRTPETEFLFSKPVRHDTIYLYKLLESLLFSSWAFFAMGIPLLLAYGIQSEAQAVFYPGVLAFLFPFVVIPAALGSLLGLLLTAIMPKHRGKILAILALIAVGFAVYVIADILNFRSGTEMRAEVHLILGRLEFAQHPLSPNFWMKEGLFELGRSGVEGLRAAGLFFIALSSTAVFLTVLGWFISASLYGRTYSSALESPRGRQVKRRWLLERLLAPLYRRHPEVMVIILKDVKTFFRDPVQWSQVLIFFGLLTIYIANLRNFSYPLDRPFYQNLISFLNLGATCLTLATMVSRFVFPLVSLEGQRFWILGLAPIERRKILIAKFFFSLAGALVLTESLVILSNFILRSDDFVFKIQALTAALICIGLTGLSVGMGALFPNLHESNPSKIVSGFGGTLTLIISISIVMCTVAAEALICHHFTARESIVMEGAESDLARQFTRALYLTLGIVAVVNALAAYLPMRLGVRALEKMEF